MKRLIFSTTLLLSFTILFAQKKPLDHTVYDGWQSIGERMISNDGKWVVYSINPQEGDNELVIQSSDATYKKVVPRGYNATITEDSRYAIFKIKPFFADTREGKIKKKKADDMPKDSFAIVELGKDSVWKLPKVKNYKTPEKEAGWVAYHLEKAIEKKETAKKPESSDKKIADSLSRVIDSLYNVIESMPKKKKKNKDDDEEIIFSELLITNYTDADGDETPTGPTDAGTDLVVRNLYDGKEKTFKNVLEYQFSKKGKQLLIEQAKNPKDSLSKASVFVYNLDKAATTVLSNGGNEFKNFSFSEDGSQVAYVAERDAKPKELQKFYKLWYYKNGMDSATMLVDKNSVGMELGMTVSEHANLSFSKSGSRLFFGTAPIQAPKDTTLIDIDLVKLDVWHYNDDYLQPVQLRRLQRDLQTSYLAVYDFNDNSLQQLETEEIPTVYQTNEGDGSQFVGVTDFGKRIESQWTGTTKKDIYAINVKDASKKLVKKDLDGFISPQLVSPTGKYIMWYESKAKNYFAWDGTITKNITANIKFPLWDEEHDSPSDPPPYGVMGWYKNDSLLFVYDQYDIWEINPSNSFNVKNITNGREKNEAYRYLKTDNEEKFIALPPVKWLKFTNKITKSEGLAHLGITTNNKLTVLREYKDKYQLTSFLKSKNGEETVILKESYTESPNLYSSVAENSTSHGIRITPYNYSFPTKLSSINPQQKDYNWSTAELYKWKAFDGKMSEGVLYKPEDFDSTKKYPMIMYFYETHSNTLHDYIDPTATGSRLNISFFVSRGYVVFSPDIHYTTGKQSKNTYDYVVSAAQSLAKKKWIDGANIGIQGQSWGGIQVAQLITMTNMFKAAWAGAPFAKMTSAYGGIRWGTGVTRQFQYEKTQSRIGATLWERPDLYIANSPLFHLPKVKTPLVIMANDADGAVPWYQGIELFTGMRRLGKKVWMLTYNGEDHNLVQRINKKDISIREQQYFDWLLKGEKPPKWIVDGIPAVKKGKDWGLELVD
ncbi:MAG: S9 family peptidase [Chitinophagaceae bacterium]|nr:S9 family peptidase [Chitinophagaceae bacterium]